VNTVIAFVLALTALVTLATSVATLLKTVSNTTQIAQIHLLVNSRLTAVIAWGDQLARILEHHGIDVPSPPLAANLEVRDVRPAERSDEPGTG
jgi:hypothetical protein